MAIEQIATDRPVVAFGPAMPGWGSWDWVGSDIRAELAGTYRTCSFSGCAIPECDVAVIIKHAMSFEVFSEAAARAAIIYCPVDFYGSAGEIDADGRALRCCARILVHCHKLARYFEPYAPVEYIDHHVKFVAPMAKRWRARGSILWVGVRTNLPPLVDWVNQHALPDELIVLTNPEQPGAIPTPEAVGFRSDRQVSILEWTRERQIELMSQARLALDIKGDDFRSRHKPAAKAIDFIASGLPLAMNQDSCVVAHLADMGFEVPSPEDEGRWFSRTYWEETQRFGLALRELLSLKGIGLRYRRIIDAVLTEHGRR
jgi:hypothetical protein